MRMQKRSRSDIKIGVVHITDRNPWTGEEFQSMEEIRQFHTREVAPAGYNKLPEGWRWKKEPWVAISAMGQEQQFGRGWSDVGYNWGINQGGNIEVGRPELFVPAHVRGHNKRALGVVMYTADKPTLAQVAALKFLIKDRSAEYGISMFDWYPHNYFQSEKTCPNFNLPTLRRFLLG